LSYALARFLSLFYQLDEETDAYLCPQIGWQQRLMTAELLQHRAQSEQDAQALLLERRQFAKVVTQRYDDMRVAVSRMVTCVRPLKDSSCGVNTKTWCAGMLHHGALMYSAYAQHVLLLVSKGVK
jgi:hypothetical protein